MPYICKEDRKSLDAFVDELVAKLKEKPFPESLGNLNYAMSRVVAGCVGEPSYSKIAMATGVLENVKQELYRRMASPYEDRKILEHGDLKEYEA